MKCKNCGSPNIYKNGRNQAGKQKYKCGYCGSEKHPVMDEEPEGVGVPLEAWLDKNDNERIVRKVMEALNADMVYEKKDIYRMCELSPGTPGLSPAIDSFAEYFGKKGGAQYFSHPDTIAALKRKGKLT